MGLPHLFASLAPVPTAALGIALVLGAAALAFLFFASH